MINIVKASSQDCKLISGMIRESFSEQAGILGLQEKDYPHYAAFETPERVCARIGRGETVLLAMLSDTPAGTVSCGVIPGNSGRGFISRLCVLPRHRGKGFGKILMKSAEETLVACGASTAQISIVAEFTRLQLYYRLMGYMPLEEKTVPSLPFKVLYLEKVL